MKPCATYTQPDNRLAQHGRPALVERTRPAAAAARGAGCLAPVRSQGQFLSFSKNNPLTGLVERTHLEREWSGLCVCITITECGHAAIGAGLRD